MQKRGDHSADVLDPLFTGGAEEEQKNTGGDGNRLQQGPSINFSLAMGGDFIRDWGRG